MIYIKPRVSILTMLLIVAISLMGCGGDDNNTASTETLVKTSSSGAVVGTDTSTDSAVTTDKAVDAKKNKNKDGNNQKKELTDDKESVDESQKKSTVSNVNSSSTKDSPKDSSSTNKDKEKKSSSDNIKVSISIDCKTLYAQDPDLANKVSNKGVIFGKKSINVKKSATVFDALKQTGINYAGTSYISTINGLSEKDGGKLSGWMFKINGTVPMESCSEYKLKDGDTIQWRYTCDGGEDI